MRVLILTQWYPPEPAVLLQELALTLQEFGHTVEVLTGFPNYPAGAVYPGYRMRLHQRETLAGVRVIRVPLYPEHSRSGFKRILNYASFALSALALGPWLTQRPDVMFVYHPPLTVGLPAWWLSRLRRVPFVYQIQDMWPETLAATGMLSNSTILKAVSGVAKWVYSMAAAVLVISPGFRANLLDKGVAADKVCMIPNWANTDAYCPEPPDPLLAESLGLRGCFTVMFAGNVGEAQGLETVLQAAELVKDDKEFAFAIVGDGVALERLKQSAEEKRLPNVRFLGRYPAVSMPKLYALADVLLVHLKDDPLFRITIPHKILAYLASGKPILVAVNGDAADVVKSAGAGVVCAPEDPPALAAAVRALHALPAEQREAMAARGRRAAESKYGRVAVVREIEAVLRSVVENYA
jgi:glycosyltransferase involved in cell wall biosynthesis